MDPLTCIEPVEGCQGQMRIIAFIEDECSPGLPDGFLSELIFGGKWVGLSAGAGKKTFY
jgi:hypothetical protein